MQCDTLLASLLSKTLSLARIAAVDRAWGQLGVYAQQRAAAAGGAVGEGVGVVTYGALDAVLDPAWHPDVRRAPPLITHAAARGAVLQGCVLVEQLLGGVRGGEGASASTGGAPLSLRSAASASASSATASPAPQSSTLAPSMHLNVTRSGSGGGGSGARSPSALPTGLAPLGVSRRAASGADLCTLDGGRVVGGLGTKHLDPPAGGKVALAGVAPLDVTRGYPTPATPRERSAAADAAAVVAAARGNMQTAPGESPFPPPAAPTEPLSRGTFDHYLALLSAGIPSDDDFSRMCDGMFHTTPAPRITAATALSARGTVDAERDAYMLPNRAKGPQSTYEELGAGLAFADAPYEPYSRVPPPPRAASRYDSAVEATGARDTRVALLVTLRDGTQRVILMPRDRYLADAPGDVNADEAALLLRLREGGVDAVAAVADF